MFRTLCKPKSLRDDGLTLIELLVSITLTGLVIASLSGAIIVILRQQSDSGGRLNNARAENGPGLWIPGDLTCAGQNVDTTASVNSASASVRRMLICAVRMHCCCHGQHRCQMRRERSPYNSSHRCRTAMCS